MTLDDDLFSELRAVAELVPQMRAGQLMAAVGEICSDLHGRGLWDAEDEELREAVFRFREGVTKAGIAKGELQSA